MPTHPVTLPPVSFQPWLNTVLCWKRQEDTHRQEHFYHNYINHKVSGCLIVFPLVWGTTVLNRKHSTLVV